MRNTVTDHYKTLGVTEDASAEDIKKAYRRLAKKYHPDATGNDAAKAEKFKEISEAYTVLSDDKARGEYDRQRRNPFHHMGGAGAGGDADGFDALRDLFSRRGRGGAGGARPGGAPQEGAEGFGFGDIFGDVFGGRGGKRAAVPDTTLAVELSFEEAALGTTLPLSFRVENEARSIKARIPPGAADGTRLRLSGQGARRGQHVGDLVLEIKVKAHAHFKREGQDIHLACPITIDEGVLGAKIEVPTLEGRATVNVPPGTSSGLKLRLRGKGIAKPDGTRGDQYVELQIVVPKSLPERARRLVEELRTIAPYNPREF